MRCRLAPEDRPSKKGHATPMEVMDSPYRAGDLRHGYQAVADNLPNDPRVHQEKGSKKIFFKNFMDARVEYVILPVGAPADAAGPGGKASGEGYLVGTLLHEIAHGLGPAFARQKRQDRWISARPSARLTRRWKKPRRMSVGMFGVKWLADRGALPKERLEEYYVSYVADIFRTLRFGTGEAHARAEMMECNYLLEHRAAHRRARMDATPSTTRAYRARWRHLSKELLEIEATGDRARAEAWFARYDQMPPAMAKALESAPGCARWISILSFRLPTSCGSVTTEGGNSGAPSAGLWWRVAVCHHKTGAGQHRADYLALHPDAASVNDADGAEAHLVRLLQISLDHALDVARRHAVQVEDVGDGDPDGFLRVCKIGRHDISLYG